MSGQTLKALSKKLDVGPYTCHIYDNCKYITEIKYASFDKLFPMVKHPYFLSRCNQIIQLSNIIQNKEFYPSILTDSIIKHVYYTSAIELENTETIGETEDIINNKSEHDKKDDILNYFEVISELYEDYKDKKSLYNRVFNLKIVMGKIFHKLYYKNNKIDKNININNLYHFRTTSVSVINLNGAGHIYLNHKKINEAISILQTHLEFLCQIADNYIFKQVKHNSNFYKENDHERLLKLACAFCIAGYLQFHFVEIHPFIDFNGRLGRLLSKHILDPYLIYPLSMFKNRNEYLETIYKCYNSDNNFYSAEPLIDLLISSALESLKENLKEIKSEISFCDYKLENIINFLKEQNLNDEQIGEIKIKLIERGNISIDIKDFKFNIYYISIIENLDSDIDSNELKMIVDIESAIDQL